MVDRKLLRVLALLLTAGLLMAACGTAPDPDPDAADPDDPGEPDDPDAAQPDPDREPGEELRIATTSMGTESLDPIQSLTDSSRYLRLMFDPLVGSDHAGMVVESNGVAEGWDISDDGLVYTFTIREGIEFHNGDPLTAEDVKFTFDRYDSELANTPNTGRLTALIDSVTVLSPTEVEVRLTEPSLMFLMLISGLNDPGGLIVPKDYIEEVGVEEFALNPVGSGPYRFVERETGSHITVERAFDEHFTVGSPRFERVTMRRVPEDSTRLALLRAGDVDFADVGMQFVEDLEAEGFRIFQHAATRVMYVMFPQTGEATDDFNLRAALSYAIDREEISESLLFGLSEPTGNVWIGVGPEPNPEIPPDPYDPDLAREHLDETRYGGDDPEPLEIVMQSYPREGWDQLLQINEALQSYWAEVDIQATIVWRDYGNIRPEWAEGALPPTPAFISDYAGQLDWSSTVVNVYTCDGLLTTVCDPELDEIHDRWTAATTMEEYVEAANEFERVLTENKYVLPLFTGEAYMAGNDQVPDSYEVGWHARGINIRAMIWDPDVHP